MITTKTLDIANRTLLLEHGKYANQATSAIIGRYGDTMVLATVVEGKVRSDIDYFPLTVEYVERLYAGGRIKGSRWVKREGRPSDDAILTARLIDRSIRPLFPKEYRNEVQVVVTVLSVDGENDPDTLSIIATSAALAISPIPWNGPVSAVRVGYVREGKKIEGVGEVIVNPIHAEAEFSDLDLVASQTKEKTLMVEAGGNQATEEHVLQAIAKAQEENKKIIELIESLIKEVGQNKRTVTKDEKLTEAISRIEKSYKDEIEKLDGARAAKEGGDAGALEEFVQHIYEAEGEEMDRKYIAQALDFISKDILKQNILKEGKRIDGRKIDEIRPITAMVSVLPRTHGSALFERGQTQALTVATLGSPRLEQLIESAEGEETKRYMHHYSMPPYSVGETGRVGFPSRREIGHGALAERAITPVIPAEDKFPYAIRVVSEIMSSNGSTSMAATCGSTLSLMDAGVPITAPIAGIAIGLMTDKEGGKYVLLTDIIGLEDFAGDMDFKVAGSKDGITAMQLDVKTDGLTHKMIEETLVLAKKGRLFILDKMLSVLPQARTEVSQFAPKIEVLHVPVEKIGEVIGPGGRVIRNIIAQTGATVEVEDDGSVTLAAITEEAVEKAKNWIEGLTREVQEDEEFEGEVKRILPFGAFVEIMPGKEGMVHVSQMKEGFVKDPTEVVSIGQKVKVRVSEVDEQGRINLTMLPKGFKKQDHPQERRGNPSSIRFRPSATRSGQSRPFGGREQRDRGGMRRPRY